MLSIRTKVEIPVHLQGIPVSQCRAISKTPLKGMQPVNSSTVTKAIFGIK